MSGTDDISFLRVLLNKKKHLSCRIVSDSMSPFIKVGDEIKISTPESLNRPLSRFDLIVFTQSNKLMCHYVWRKNKHFNKGKVLATRSLKNPREDDYPVSQEHILGVVVGKKLSWWRRLKILIMSMGT